MTAPPDVSFDDYMVESMKDPAQAAAYIEAVIDLEDPVRCAWRKPHKTVLRQR